MRLRIGRGPRLLLLPLLLAAPSRAETPCQDCWTEQCKEFKGAIPKCKPAAKATPKAVAAAEVVAPCPTGKVRNRDTQGQCCWPGQSYNSSRMKCIGEPECLPGFKATGDDCTAVPAAPPRPASPHAGAPALTEAEVEQEAANDEKRDGNLEALKRIIPKIEDGSPQKADLLFQMAELFWEKSRYLYRKEMAALPEDHRQSGLHVAESMRLYEVILRDYPAYDRNDEVSFQLAFSQYAMGKREAAITRFEALGKDYPRSKFAGDAFVQLGNHYFEVEANLKKATAAFEKALESSKPPVKGYALYKLAWCELNAGQIDGALRRLQETIDFAERQPDRSLTAIKNEALTDSIRMFVELNRVDEAIAYFGAHAGKKKKVTLLTKLGHAFQEAGRHESAIKTFRVLLQENPTSELTVEWQQGFSESEKRLSGSK